ncbi:MAG: flagellin [Solirubrobacteraceae bacterium]
MSLIINTNTQALIAHNNLVNTDNAMSSAMQDLSSGLRINTAADDAAGYAITEDLTSQVNGLNQANQNAQDGVSMVQTAQGTLNDVEQMLQRVRELAVQYANGTNDAIDQNAITSEVSQLMSEISQLGTTAQFNSIGLFSATTSISFQVGANYDDQIAVTLQEMSALVSGSVTLGQTATLSTISTFIDNVSTAAANFGAVQNRLSYVMDNLSTYSENLSSAQSTIQDVDMASEETEFTKDQILEQAGVSMLAQANQDPQMVLKLLG